MKKAFLTGLTSLAAAISIEASATLPQNMISSPSAIMIEDTAIAPKLDLSKPFVLERPADTVKMASHYSHSSHSSHASHASHSSHYSSRY